MKGAAKPCLTDDFCSTEPGGNVVNHDFGLLVGTFDDVKTEYNPTFEIPENVTRLGLYWHPVQTAREDNCKLYRQVVAGSAGQRYRVDYFNWSTNATSATGTLRLTNVDNGRTLDTAGAVISFNRYIWEQTMRAGVFFFPCKVLYCGYNSEIEKLSITANIA